MLWRTLKWRSPKVAEPGIETMGMMMSPTRAVTTSLKAVAMTKATARSSTLSRRTNALNSWSRPGWLSGISHLLVGDAPNVDPRSPRPRQSQADAGSALLGRVDPGAAALRLGELLHDGQPDARPGDLVGRSDPVETLEDAFGLGGRDAGTLIGNP